MLRALVALPAMGQVVRQAVKDLDEGADGRFVRNCTLSRKAFEISGFHKWSFAHGLAPDGKSSQFLFHNPLAKLRPKAAVICMARWRAVLDKSSGDP